MAKTLLDKIWSEHCIKPLADDEDLMYIDMHLLHEINTPQAFDNLRATKRTVRRPDLTVATEDHNTPTRSIEALRVDEMRKHQVDLLRQNCSEFGIPLYKLGEPGQGITHVIAPEQGLVLPGTTLVCCDSHTTTHGAFATLAFGIGTSQVEHVLTTQTLRLQRFKSMRIKIENNLQENISSKDLALYIISQIGTGGGIGHIIEYAGDAIHELSMEARMTLCNMAVESGACAGIIGVDDVTINYLYNILRDRPHIEEEIERWREFVSDTDATFDKEIVIDGNAVTERVTWGTNPSQNISFNESIPDVNSYSDASEKIAAENALEYMKLKSGQSLRDISIDKVFVGSCTNGRIEDLRVVASILEGKHVHSNVHMVIVPGSIQVRDQAINEGLDIIFEKAGADFRHLSGCSMCVGLNDDSMKKGQRSVSTSNRNFEGRQGPGSMTHIASPAVAAASAIMGRIACPSDLK
ncbi:MULTISPECIES: 3-isopropylmalate dehydratase large subunit [Bacillus cereus group]|uniref:3-isopropylmalate dehydratase large subunit n=1 Tax=Bacillus cereus group TaxID=86661 RepID=UPI000BF29055|nr:MULTISPECIES: 3-isopropylmalate dehydratase large subunit [Bacillus cereus group]MBY0018461.1 3-isopropylmalate dehydratase large subunit [Bacillus cereus]PEY81754.1 3-isopropylmalate dehydratase large subunit [Bacillus thuringiensis]PFD38591.1 3-isopropylmalate dehydratase large subunit [Bacillus thuringiensis]PFE60501.1 3-isopropylmalate dehydratase large subunit [Bacillus thuringiensis]PFI31131.1 3-isopropylmalate dehydratase large subunit [Bacillus thuringiensis]